MRSEAQPSKLFGAFERARAATKAISEVNQPSGLARGSGEVAAAFNEYFEKLFSLSADLDDPPRDVFDELPVVPEHVEAVLNNPIMVEDVKRAITK